MKKYQIELILILSIIGILSITFGFVTAQDPDPFDCPYPDLEINALNYQSPTHTGSEFTFTIIVTNKGLATSEETGIQILLPLFVTMTAPVTVPPLQPGESIEITITITIPPEASIGYGSLQVTINPENVNPECSYTNNHLSGDLLILPPGMTQEEYDRQTGGPTYPITELYRDENAGVEPTPTPGN